MQSRLLTFSIAWLSLMVLVTNACSEKKEEAIPELGTSYFPLRSGLERIYLVDSLAYDNNTGSTVIDTFQYYYKEQIGATFTNDAGEKGYFISRYYADTPDGNWSQTFRWTAYQNQLLARQVEDNQVFVKQVYPLNATKNWDGNMYNNRGEQRFRVIAFDAPYGNYPNTVLIQHQNDSNFIELIRKEERYAKGVGLVYFKFDSINTQVSGSRGFRKRYTLIKYQ